MSCSNTWADHPPSSSMKRTLNLYAWLLRVLRLREDFFGARARDCISPLRWLLFSSIPFMLRSDFIHKASRKSTEKATMSRNDSCSLTVAVCSNGFAAPLNRRNRHRCNLRNLNNLWFPQFAVLLRVPSRGGFSRVDFLLERSAPAALECTRPARCAARRRRTRLESPAG